MRITKDQIDFFGSYIAKDTLRPALTCLYLDMSTLRVETHDDSTTRYASLCATNGFALGCIEVELEDSDITSYLIPYEHLAVAKHYLDKKIDWMSVFLRDGKIVYQTFAATIEVNPVDANFPDYKKITEVKHDTEYVIYVGAKLLKDVAESHIKLGQDYVYIRMSGGNTPISFAANNASIISLLMPVHLDQEAMGKLQKESRQ